MDQALQLAALGRFTTTPNPNVGCVIANAKQQLIGRGFHQQAGTPHAEVHALAEAGAAAKGATAYVTLEPCSHFGRTPPCADALIEAGVSRVVVAMQDPYHEVSGRGIARLRKAGIQVEVGLMSTQAKALNAGFIKRAERGLPYVRVKLAASLDGRTALANGQSQWITGPAARHDVQFGRAASSAVLTGAGTVLADDPLLNVRLERHELPVELAQSIAVRQPVRVVVDNQSQIKAGLRLFDTSGPVWLARPEGASRAGLPDNATMLAIAKAGDSQTTRVDLTALMKELASQGINDIWVEAGPRLSGALLAQGLVDELVVYMAPKLMGPDAKSLLELPGYTQMADVPSWQFAAVEKLGDDIKLVLRPQSAA